MVPSIILSASVSSTLNLKLSTACTLSGECALCSGFGIFMSQLDGGDKLRFATQQSDIGKKLAANSGWVNHSDDLSTMLVVHTPTKAIWIKSSAALRTLLVYNAWFLPLVAFGWAIPTGVRDGIYEFVARNRIAWFGSKPLEPSVRFERKILR